MKLVRRGVIGVVALAVVGLPVVTGGQASAASVAPAGLSAAAALTPCLTDVAARKRKERRIPTWRRYGDTSKVTARDLAALPGQQTRRGFVAREVEPRLAAIEYIPVYVHVIKGRHRGERVPAGPKRVRTLLATLNDAMAGKQSSLSVPTRYRFVLKKINYRKRDGWHHAFLNGPRDQRMKRKLHRGDARTLNLYINGGGPRGEPVLGWSRFPWQYAAKPYMDGVSVNMAALRGGKATGYNLGDTVVHETGHWLGLFHTFEGGCGETGDLVADTPAEAEPSFFCETKRDTCAEDPGLDPVHNFMDYSQDACMNQLTAGQVRRMDSAFEKWRL